jgi:hypothetical protein
MGSRLLPLSLVLGATLADAVGVHRIALWLVLLAIPCGAAAAFLAVSDLLDGKRAWARTLTTSGSLILLLVASAVRHNAAVGHAVPALAVSAAIAAAMLYLLPALFWVLQPVSLRPAQPVSS